MISGVVFGQAIQNEVKQTNFFLTCFVAVELIMHDWLENEF